MASDMVERYVRDAWYVCARSGDVHAGAPFAISVLNQPMVIWRGEDGTCHALEDRCVHRLAPLSLGRCEGSNLRCMYHGLLYAPDGKVLEIPGQDVVPARARVRSWPTVDRHDWIWVWMGDPQLADAAMIPPAVGNGQGYLLGSGQMDYLAEARLINDNLLDFSHLSFVHASSFDAGPEFAACQPSVTLLERGVRVDRWIRNTHGAAARKSNVPVDSWQSYQFLVPGILLMWSANFPCGTADALGSASPAPDQALSGLNFTSQAVTPMTGKTARYFYSWGPHERHGGEEQRDRMMEMAGRAFGEDRTMIEAQQRVIDATPDPRIMPTKHDKAITLYNGLVKRLIDLQGVADDL